MFFLREDPPCPSPPPLLQYCPSGFRPQELCRCDKIVGQLEPRWWTGLVNHLDVFSLRSNADRSRRLGLRIGGWLRLTFRARTCFWISCGVGGGGVFSSDVCRVLSWDSGSWACSVFESLSFCWVSIEVHPRLCCYLQTITIQAVKAVFEHHFSLVQALQIAFPHTAHILPSLAVPGATADAGVLVRMLSLPMVSATAPSHSLQTSHSPSRQLRSSSSMKRQPGKRWRHRS